MRVLVTGGAGFIGSHLVGRLVNLGHEVTVADCEATGRRGHVPPGARFERADVSRDGELEPLFACGIDAVLHVAGQVSLIRSFSDPLADLRTNVEGTVNVLRGCLAHKVPRLLYASSMTVYGHSETLPTGENVPGAPISYYGITKYAAERYVHATAQRRDLASGLEVTSFRMFNVYGPGQALDNPYQGVLGIFLGNLLRDEPITIFGDGRQSRDFIYIDDVVDAWMGALDNPASYGHVINLGSGQRLSINALADHALSAFGHSRKVWPVRYAPARPGEQRHVEADIRRARSMLRWEPTVPFSVGLAETVRWASATATGVEEAASPARTSEPVPVARGATARRPTHSPEA